MNASAPGKLFLVGEYAVLEGGPALLVPVKRRAEVTIEASNESQVISYTTVVEKRSPEEALRLLTVAGNNRSIGLSEAA
jgi:mevalonate kinase